MGYRGVSEVELACNGKRVHQTWTAAQQTLRRMQRKGKAAGFRSGEVYRCRHCHKFHVASVDQWQ